MGTQPSRTVCDLVDRRDGCRCLICGNDKADGWSGQSRHHRLMRSHPWPGLHEPQNLIRVCGSGTTGCHGAIHADPGKAYRYGWLVHGWVDDPGTVPILTHAHGWVYLLADGSMRPLTGAELDAWMLATGLRWHVEDLEPMVGHGCSVTLPSGFVDHGTLTGVTKAVDGVVAVRLDDEVSWRLEDNATIEFDNEQNQVEETQ